MVLALINKVVFYHDQWVAELSKPYEELQYDIVKDGCGQSKENEKDHHHVKKDRPEIARLDEIIKEQEKQLRKLQREVIKLRKMVEDKRKSQLSYGLSPTATPVGSPRPTAAASRG